MRYDIFTSGSSEEKEWLQAMGRGDVWQPSVLVLELGAGYGPDQSPVANTTLEFVHQGNQLTPSRKEPSSTLLCINVGKQDIMMWGQADCEPNK